MGTFGNAQIGANADITSMTGLSDDGIPHAKIANLQGNKNAIINGDFNIWQRGTSFAAIANEQYAADRFLHTVVGVGVVTYSRDTDVPTQAESGHKSNYSLKVDCTTIDASIDAGDIYGISQSIEGYNFAPFVGKAVTLSFWVKAVKAGIYCVSFRSGAYDRSYVAEYTINSASTWEKKTITLTFDYSGGTWDYTNGLGLRITWALAVGSTYQGTANTWNAANNFATSNQVNGVDHTDNNFWLAQVQFELGSVATDFEYRQFGDELAKCKRYFEKSFDYATAPAQNAGLSGIVLFVQNIAGANTSRMMIPFKQTKRALPTMVYFNPQAANAYARNIDIAADFSSFATYQTGDSYYCAGGVAPAGGGVGETCGVHYTASSEL